MTRRATTSTPVPRRVLAVAAAAALIMLIMWLDPTGDRRPVAAETPSAGAWQTIEHQGVTVDVPSTWQRTDTSGCELEIVRWGDPASPPCTFENGVAFYASATFDPASGPGVLRGSTAGAVTWSGYAYAGDLAVCVFGNEDRDLVRDILASAHRPE